MIPLFRQNVPWPFLKNRKVRNIGTPLSTCANPKEQWLDSMGGRTLADVLKDDRGEYVLMATGTHGKYKSEAKQKVYIPKKLSTP